MKTVLITGASSGIGKACSEKFASSGYQVVMCARRIDKLQSICQEFPDKQTCIYQVDVCNKENVESMFEDLKKKKITIDIVVNSAGLALGLDDIRDANTSDWDSMIDTNIKGLLYTTQEFLKQTNKGHVVNVGSIAGIYAYAKGTVYAATKSAVKFISDGLRKELVSNDIKITNIQPGLVETNFSNVRFNGDKKRAKDVYKGIQALTGDDIANIVFYVVNTPEHVQITELTVMPLHQASVDTVYRSQDQ